MPEISPKLQPFAQEARKYKSAEEAGLKINFNTKIVDKKATQKIIDNVISETNPQYLEGMEFINVEESLGRAKVGEKYRAGHAYDNGFEITTHYDPEFTKTLLNHEIGHRVYDVEKLMGKDVVWNAISGMNKNKVGLDPIVEKFAKSYSEFKVNPQKLKIESPQIYDFFKNLNNESFWDKFWAGYKNLKGDRESQLTDFYDQATKGVEMPVKKIVQQKGGRAAMGATAGFEKDGNRY